MRAIIFTDCYKLCTRMKTNLALLWRLALVLGFSLAASRAETNTNPPQPALPETRQECFQCRGRGTAKCPAIGCHNGQRTCPAPCLKLSVGIWEKREAPGHTDPNERWQKVQFGKKSAYWSSGHLGEIPTLAKDGTFSSPRCGTCSGTTLVPCAQCAGKSTVACEVCAGQKNVPASWSAFDHPRLKNRPDRIHLTDGTVLTGRKLAEADGTTSIRTERKIEHVASDRIRRIEPQPTETAPRRP